MRTVLFLLCVFLCKDVIAQNSTCGVQTIKPHGHSRIGQRIVGGRESVPHSWPWMVLLRFRDAPITCGGTLIRGGDGKLVVLTAAHCVDGISTVTDWKIEVGKHSRSALEPNQNTYAVKEITVHPNFNFQFLDDDLAILKPDIDIQTNDYVQPICLTTEDSGKKVGQNCVVIGWGATYQGGSPVDRLNEVYKPILKDSDCITALSAFGFNNVSMLCAGNLVSGGVDACSYDSGVPFACKNSLGIWELVGVSSWGFGCAQPGYPGVYVEVNTFLQWITDNSHSTSTDSPIVG